MIKLTQLLTEAKESFEQFAKNRLAGAEKIIANAKEKGGDAMLTYNHFNVKPSYYKKAIDGNIRLVLLKYLGDSYLSDSYSQENFQQVISNFCQQ